MWQRGMPTERGMYYLNDGVQRYSTYINVVSGVIHFLELNMSVGISNIHDYRWMKIPPADDLERMIHMDDAMDGLQDDTLVLLLNGPEAQEFRECMVCSRLLFPSNHRRALDMSNYDAIYKDATNGFYAFFYNAFRSARWPKK